ncbi:MAG: tyrosine--tRNA ligase [Planctomycetes bacterium]|nr:tyrosine--tRNA ligase [Planctomycetota bacterium]HPF15781.1 tyrosine--tRNA ligase [Planctomycetota bacterium]HRV81879.1 tyrosine--tRNA ligase [Planctomycetota bacterium]
MAKPVSLNQDLDAHLAAFRRGHVDWVDEGQLRSLLRARLDQGQGLRVKFGMDPSSPDLHVGHSIPLLKLRDLQQLGHTVVLIVGDATAMVGDPTGRSQLRPILTRAQVDDNLKTYVEQAGLVLDMEHVEVRRNSEWFDRMGFEELLKLCTRMTVAQMIERDTFQTRMEAKEPIGINEFLYPLMQGWDSVMVQADVELGGTDQLFNLLVGRRLQEQENQRPQVVLTTPLINGLDGRKMSKSYGNAVSLTDDARSMTFALMRLDDEAMPVWFEQLTRLPVGEIQALLKGHPREAKARLALEVTQTYHGLEAALDAAQAFDREVRDKELPPDIEHHAWQADWGAELPLPNLLANLGLVASTSEARRMIQQGAVRVGGEIQRDPHFACVSPKIEQLIQVGKKRFAYLDPGASS